MVLSWNGIISGFLPRVIPTYKLHKHIHRKLVFTTNYEKENVFNAKK